MGYAKHFVVNRFWEELGSTFDKISKDGSVHAVVLSSRNPKIFTAGLDCKSNHSFYVVSNVFGK